MIIAKAVDVEIFHNLFSITFVDVKDYLQKFADCIDENGKPVALTEKLSVTEIKRRLDTINCDIFYISDTDDSQLMPLVNCFYNMQAHYETITDENGNVSQYPVRYDLFGFNNVGYDDYIIKAFLMKYNRFDTTKELITYLKQLSDKIIRLQNDREAFYEDKEIDLIRSYRLPYCSVDVQQIYALHSAGVIIDKDTGERNKYGKSLKQTSINLKWHELLDFTLPPIDEEEYNLYWKEHSRLSFEELSKMPIEHFNRYILPKYIKPMLYYNRNDVFLVIEIARQKPDEIKLRYAITTAFRINVMASARANIADKLLTKLYSDMSGLPKERFEKGRTNRTALSFKKIIFPHIEFKTKELQDVLNEMKDVIIYHTNKDSFTKTVKFYGTTYTLATGGIHSVDLPRILQSTDEYRYCHWDYSSYYPSIMISYKVYPKHLNQKVFTKLVRYLRDTRISAKHNKNGEDVIKGVPNKITAEALKIVINAIYGKLGSDKFWLYDRFAQMQVTINGQLMTMTLIEELELNGIHVVSANTDGIVLKLPIDKEDVFKEITSRWNEKNMMSADGEYYKIVVSRDVNNYFDIQSDDSVEFKGALDPKQYLKELKKGYDMPIVAEAVYQYFANNVPVMETLRNHKDILDFCKTQNVGKQFEVVYNTTIDGKSQKVYSQRHVRFYVSYRGVVIQKEHKETKQLSVLASGRNVTILNSLDDKPIEERDINYGYYYNECYKIIDPIKLGISPNQKGDKDKGVKSGKLLIKRRSHAYVTLFDNEEE
jgi:hypothetical protein